MLSVQMSLSNVLVKGNKGPLVFGEVLVCVVQKSFSTIIFEHIFVIPLNDSK